MNYKTEKRIRRILHEMEAEGAIEKGDAKEIARTHSIGDISDIRQQHSS